MSDHGFIHSIYFRDPNGYVIEQYAKSGMGGAFCESTVRGAPDPMKPYVLIYEPVGKELKLVAVEWLVPATPDTKERPSLFGQPFQGSMEGHEPLIPQAFVHYDLHAWLRTVQDNLTLARLRPPTRNVSGATRICPAGKANQADARAMILPDSVRAEKVRFAGTPSLTCHS